MMPTGQDLRHELLVVCREHVDSGGDADELYPSLAKVARTVRTAEWQRAVGVLE